MGQDALGVWINTLKTQNKNHKIREPMKTTYLTKTHKLLWNWKQRLTAFVCFIFAVMSLSVWAGPVVIDGTDANDSGHGGVSGGVNVNGWLYMQRVLENLAPQVGNGNKIVVDLGTVPGSQARAAIDSAFNLSSLPGAGWTIVHFTTAPQIASFLSGGTVLGVSLSTAGIIYIPTLANATGDLSSISGAITAVNGGAAAIANFVGGAGNPFAGGGLFAMSENGGGAFGWLSTLIPGIVVTQGGSGTPINLTVDGVAAFPSLPNSAVQAAIPWHAEFSGNLGSLKVLGVADRSGLRNVILGGGSATLIGELSVTPSIATNEVGTAHTVCAAAVTTVNGVSSVVVGTTVSFSVNAGPNTGVNGTSVTDSNGVACFTYVGTGGVGVDVITATFVDVANISHSGQAIKVWVQSNHPPTATGYPGLVVDADPNTCTANVSADNGSSDPDGDAITVTATPPAPYPLGTNVVQLCVTDSKGASNCTTSIIIVQDVSAPIVSCPADITVANDAGQCSAVVTYVASASDCGGIASFVCVPPSGGVFPVGTNVVTCTAVDAAGNTNSCSFNVVVLDTTPPDITCPANIVVGNDPGQCSAVVNYTVTATDNCTATCGINVDVYSGFTLIGGGAPYSGLLGSFSSPGVSFATDYGFNWHPFGAADFGAAITGCITVAAEGDYVFGLDSDDGSLLGIDGVLVVDNGGPHAPGSGYGPSVHLTAGVHSFEVQFFECCGGPSGVDVLLPAGVTFGGVMPVTVVCNPPSGSTFPKGTTTVVCTATDAAGNTNTCTFDVTVEDREAPVGACREGVNPSGKKIPVAGKNPSSGQNPDGFYQLLSKDNCDSDPAIYLADTGSTFIAGPFHNGDVIKLTQSPGRKPGQDQGAGVVVAHLHFKGDGVLYAVDADGNTSETCLCLVPRPPK